MNGGCPRGVLRLLAELRMSVSDDFAPSRRELARALGVSPAAAMWLVVGCALSALAAASLGLEVESAELAPLGADGPEAWDAWVSAGDDPAAELWREAVGVRA